MRWVPSLTLVGLAVRRLVHNWPLALAQLLGVAAAVTLVASIPLMQSAAAEAGLAQSLGSIGRGAAIEIQETHVSTAADFDQFQASSAKLMQQELAESVVPGAHYGLTSALQVLTLNGVSVTGSGAPPPEFVRFYENVQSHVQLVAGGWTANNAPPGDYQMTLSQQVANRIGLKAGDTYCLRLPSYAYLYHSFFVPPVPACFFLSGIWTPVSASDPFWGGGPPTGLVLDRAAYFRFLPTLIPNPPPNPFGSPTFIESSYTFAGQYWATDLSRVHAADAPQLLSKLEKVQGEFQVGRNADFITGMPAALRAFDARLTNARTAGLLVEVALLAIALYAVGFVGSLFLDGQLREVALWRARGWSRRRLWLLLSLQFAVISLVAAPLGLALAFKAVQVLAAGVLGPTAKISTASLPGLEPEVLGIIAAGLLLLGWQAARATDRGLVDTRRQASRPPARPWWRTRNLDLLVAAIGAGLLGYAHFASGATATSDAGSTDPLSLVLPVVALALIAPATLRLLALAPPIIGGRGRPLTGTLTAWQLKRHAGEHVRLALLLSFAIAIVLFASAYAATDRQNVIDRTGYQAGADVRVLFALSSQPSPVDAVAELPGVSSATQLYRSTGRPGKLEVDTTVLGIDGAGVWNAAWHAAPSSSAQLESQTKVLADDDPDGIPIGQAEKLSLWVNSSGFDGRVSAQLSDGMGAAFSTRLGDLTFTGWKQLTAQLSATSYPLKFRALAFEPVGLHRSGAVALSDLAADGKVVETFAEPSGWWQQMTAPRTAVDDLPTGPAAARDGKPALSASLDLSSGATLIRPAPSSKPLPALLATATLQKVGIGLGKAFTLRIESENVLLVAVGTLDYFPTLYPGVDDFLLTPRLGLLDRLIRAGTLTAYTNEVWLRVPGPTAQLTSQIHDSLGPSVIELVDRKQLEAAAVDDPLRKSLHAELLIGFLAALTMVVIAFALHFLAVTRGRVAEFAILQANGLPWRRVSRGLFAEQLILLGYGLLVGAAMGLLLSWVILPELHLANAPSDLTPPTTLVVDRLTAGFAAAGLGLACIVVGRLAARLGGRFQLVRELRSLA